MPCFLRRDTLLTLPSPGGGVALPALPGQPWDPTSGTHPQGRGTTSPTSCSSTGGCHPSPGGGPLLEMPFSFPRGSRHEEGPRPQLPLRAVRPHVLTHHGAPAASPSSFAMMGSPAAARREPKCVRKTQPMKSTTAPVPMPLAQLQGAEDACPPLSTHALQHGHNMGAASISQVPQDTKLPRTLSPLRPHEHLPEARWPWRMGLNRLALLVWGERERGGQALQSGVHVSVGQAGASGWGQPCREHCVGTWVLQLGTVSSPHRALPQTQHSRRLLRPPQPHRHQHPQRWPQPCAAQAGWHRW